MGRGRNTLSKETAFTGGAPKPGGLVTWDTVFKVTFEKMFLLFRGEENDKARRAKRAWLALRLTLNFAVEY